LKAETSRFDKAFIERQREHLTRARAEILDAMQTRKAEEADINSQSSGEALESEDDAQRLAMLELDGNLIAREIQRLAQIERTLKKINDGTYGFSDASGDPIPIERLEAFPEAIFTAAEQGSRSASA
jgi:DnaK suppressor protein